MEEKIVEVTIDALSGGVYDELTDIQKANLLPIITQIKTEMSRIKQLEFVAFISNKNRENAQRFLKQLDNVAVSDYEVLKDQDQNTKELIINSVTKLYFLTEQYFITMGLIQKPKFQMTGIVDGMYIQKDFETILLENAAEFLSISQQSSSKGGNIGLRFQTSKVIDLLKKSVENDEKQKRYAQDLYKHYKTFSAPFMRAERKGANINHGVVREAFEVHLENLHNSLGDSVNYQFKNCRMESVGKRWVLYRYASGSDPYFTGPDTMFSQVKAENASLVSNINTILNVAEYILTKANVAGTTKADIEKALRAQNTDDIHSFSGKLWEFLSEKSKNIVTQELGKKLKNGTVKLKFT